MSDNKQWYVADWEDIRDGITCGIVEADSEEEAIARFHASMFGESEPVDGDHDYAASQEKPDWWDNEEPTHVVNEVQELSIKGLLATQPEDAS